VVNCVVNPTYSARQRDFRPGPTKGVRGHDSRVGSAEVKVADKSRRKPPPLNMGDGAQLVRMSENASLVCLQAHPIWEVTVYNLMLAEVKSSSELAKDRFEDAKQWLGSSESQRVVTRLDVDAGL
jgi:hypothetical protein